MIRLERVSKTFRRDGVRIPILHDVSFTLPEVPGLALLGRNGAGKSTLLRLIAGSLRPDRGRVVTTRRISWPMGFAGGFHPSLSGAQNARFVARLHGCDPQDLAARVEDFAELGDGWRRPVSTYSQGMRARLAFAVSMAIDFDVYLVDEIIGVGDARFRQKCAQAFRARMGRCQIIMVSHNPETLRLFCQAGLVLEQGRLVYHTDIEDALAHHDDNLDRPPAHGPGQTTPHKPAAMAP
ncbi:MAG: ABC transporter ATP-binding protein [Pseudomonadota bacterium]